MESADREKQQNNLAEAWAVQPVHVQAQEDDEDDSDGQSDEDEEIITIADQELQELHLDEYN